MLTSNEQYIHLNKRKEGRISFLDEPLRKPKMKSILGITLKKDEVIFHTEKINKTKNSIELDLSQISVQESLFDRIKDNDALIKELKMANKARMVRYKESLPSYRFICTINSHTKRYFMTDHLRLVAQRADMLASLR